MRFCILFFLFLIYQASAQQSITWENTQDISAASNGNLHPRIVLDRGENPLIIWGRSNDQSFFFSRWNGNTFTTPVKLNANLTIATASWMGPDIAAHGDTVYAVMKETPESATASHLYLVRSFDGGNSFSPPQQIDAIADSISRFPTLTTDAIGNPIVAFMKFNDAFLESRWAVMRSSDFGATFSQDGKASGWGNSASVCDCCPGAIVSAGNNCGMLYRDNNANLRDTWLGLSRDNGNSFEVGCNIDHNNWMVNACPATGPDGVVLGDTLYSVFCSGAGGAYRVYSSKTLFSSPAWIGTQNLGTGISGLSQQNYPRIAASGRAMGIVWTQVANGVTQLPLLFTNDIQSGAAPQYGLVDLNNVTNADIAIGNGVIYVCWEDDGSGTVKFRKGRFNAVSHTETEPLSNAFQVFPNPIADYLNLQIEASRVGENAVFYDVMGKKIKTVSLSGTEMSIETGELPSGVYWLKMEGVMMQPVKIFKQ